MIPAPRLLAVVAAWAALGLIVSIWPAITVVWSVCGLLLLVVSAVDAWQVIRTATPDVQRRVSPAIAVQQRARVVLQLASRGSRPVRLQVFDRPLGAVDVLGLPTWVTLTEETGAEIGYQLTPRVRGWLHFDAVDVRVESPLALWQRRVQVPLPDAVRVLPDFSMLALKGQDLDARLARSDGFRRVRRRGLGTDFHQLREYQPGDAISQIDWKATARHNDLIAREYEAEKGQQVLLLLDASRRMRSADDGLSHFDATMMSALRLAHIALTKGDRVGCLTFGGEERWVPPKPGRSASSAILHALFDVFPSLEPPDYIHAAHEVLRRTSRRTLVVLITNLRDEDNEELIPAARIIARHHLLLVTSLREGLLQDIEAAPVETFDDAATYLSTLHYQAAREKSLHALRQHVSHVVDAPAGKLAPMMISHYLAIKEAQEL